MPLEPQRMDLSALESACQQESGRFFRNENSDDRFCYELFRRAIEQGNKYAWDSIMVTYQNLVRGWIRRNSLLDATDIPLEELTALSYQRFWYATSRVPFTRFPTLQAILQYLNLCCGSAVTDKARRARREPSVSALENHYDLSNENGDGAGYSSMEDDERTLLWQRVEAVARTEAEQILLDACFNMDLPPRRILEAYPDHFHEIQDIYRIKRNLLNRLRNDSVLRDIANNN